MTDIVVFSLEKWDGVWRRNQHLVHRLLRDDPELRVLFIEPPRDPLHELRSRRPARPGAGLRAIDGYGGRLMAYEPTKWIPRAAPFGLHALELTARRGIRLAGYYPDLFWVNAPQWGRFAIDSPVPVIYDITDDWTLASRGRRTTEVTLQDDLRLLQHSDAVVVCSPQLDRSKGAVRDVVLIPNAVDVSSYRGPIDRPSELPSGPVALYAGTLHEDRLDVQLAVALSASLDAIGATLVFVGPIALGHESREVLQSAKGVKLVGAVDSSQVPAYLTSADVLVVPHVVTPFTESLDPIKLYEYLAAGRPIVSTSVAGFRDRVEVRALEGEAFREAVVELVSPRRDSEVRENIPDWDERAAALRVVVDSVIGAP